MIFRRIALHQIDDLIIGLDYLIAAEVVERNNEWELRLHLGGPTEQEFIVAYQAEIDARTALNNIMLASLATVITEEG